MSAHAYVVLGQAGPARDQAVAALAAAASEEGVATHTAGPGQWELADGLFHCTPPEGTQALFLLAPDPEDPRDFLEAVATWLPGSGFELARVITVLSCADAERQGDRFAGWIGLWLHFTDYLVLTDREGVSSKWINALTARLKEEALPCQVEFWKKDSPRNPALVLLPEARRIAHLFDLEPQLPADLEPVIEEGDEDEDAEPPDPWLERLASGQRARPVPSRLPPAS
jgi:hypothetical protein